MILIADSGSSKTAWKLVDKTEVVNSYETIGFNPYIISSKEVLEVLNSSELSSIQDNITEVHLYAAGCTRVANQEILKEPLTQFFSKATINVYHDLLAAARATCGKEKGMVAILGTGSNSCVYNGVKIVENITSLGYILGDYGGGVNIGKTFLSKLLGGDLPKNIEIAFEKEYNLSVADILDAIYKKSLPNRFIAGFSKFVYQNIQNEELNKIVRDCFKSFFETNICKYENHRDNPLHFVGSIAFVYQDILKEVSNEYDVNVGLVIKDPIDNLVSYHLSN